MYRYKLTLRYDGSAFLGWQKQPEGRTVQAEVEKAISQILNTPTAVTGSGRTDALVHALKQVGHFDADKYLDLGKFRYSLNCLLPEDIHVLEVSAVRPEFHARYGVQTKHYRYLLNCGESDPLLRHYRYEYGRPLDVAAMRQAAGLFIGKHNFANFTTKEEDEDGFVRELFSVMISDQAQIVTFDFRGQGFMRYMVRMIVGALIAVGSGKEDASFIKRMLTETPRQPISYKAPPQGLYLVDVTYREDD